MNSSEHTAQHYIVAMYRKLKVNHNDVLRRLLGVPGYTSARTLCVNKRPDNVDVLIRKQYYNLKLRIGASTLFAIWRDNIEVTRI